MASAAVIAERTDRELIVIWRPDHHCEARLGDLLEYDGLVIEDETGGLLRKSCDRVYNYMEIEESADFQASILDDDSPSIADVYIRSAYTLNSPLSDRGAENRFLRSLRANSEVASFVRQVAHPSDLTVHIRMASGPDFEHLSYESPENWPEERHQELTRWRRKSDVSRFIKRIDTLRRERGVETIFVAADLPATYSALIERYGESIRHLPRTQYDRSAAQLQTALADMILLTSAPIFLGSTWSSFSDIAQRIARSGRHFEQSGVDF